MIQLLRRQCHFVIRDLLPHLGGIELPIRRHGHRGRRLQVQIGDDLHFGRDLVAHVYSRGGDDQVGVAVTNFTRDQLAVDIFLTLFPDFVELFDVIDICRGYLLIFQLCHDGLEH